jgi:hypothetical protein
LCTKFKGLSKEEEEEEEEDDHDHDNHDDRNIGKRQSCPCDLTEHHAMKT